MDSKKRSRPEDDMTDAQISKQQMLDTFTSANSLLPTTALLDVQEDFRIVVGTYERLLYGINAFWNEDKTKVDLQPIFIIPAHTGCIRTVAIGGHFLASGSTDEIIRLYDVKKRKEYGSLGGHHSGDITDIQFHGKYMLSASDDHSINLWRTKDWEFLKNLKAHKGRVNSMAIHPTGKIALSVGIDRACIVWNLMTGRRASVNKVGREEPMMVLWNSAGDKYAILFDKTINIYNVADAKVATSITHTSRFHTMQYFRVKESNKDYIVSGSEDKTIRIWDVETGECVREILAHKLRVKAVTVIDCDDKLVLASVSSDGLIRCWDLEKALTTEGEIEPLGEFNTKCRATCITSHVGFAKLEAIAAEEAAIETAAVKEEKAIKKAKLEAKKAKNDEFKKAELKKAESEKAESKKKAQPKKKVQPKKVQPNKEQPKKVETKKAEPQKKKQKVVSKK
ncbi:WD40-repeat-containing domain protein [Helicostylum pulchrum]|uniref:P21-activated protein kinase-interacting protein 1-like n=1 Tax=Helicostylum pulchrum TaxID=562976 RepID=A0ABP9YCE6_9FUNG|nr:WD40-repeat-containing domain protein [Helicostylum pulchrum]